jgi:DNA-binding HxlR family transcriptional regulator
MPQEPTDLDLQVIQATENADLIVHRVWVLPILFALRDGDMDRAALKATAEQYRPGKSLSDRMVTHTALALEAAGLVAITRSPDHPDTLAGARYALTDRGRVLAELSRASLPIFAQAAQDGDGPDSGDHGSDPESAAS